MDALRAGFEPIATAPAMTWQLHDAASRPRVLNGARTVVFR